MSTERPILFSGPMVKAILNGTKTMTRRVVKLPIMDRNGTGCELGGSELSRRDLDMYCPHGKTGDLLWVRETFTRTASNQMGQMVGVCFKDGAQKYKDGRFLPPLKEYSPGAFDHIKWKPSIHLPRWASRITLEITGVRVERLQSINSIDLQREGIVASPAKHWYHAPDSYEQYRKLWDSLNAKRDGGIYAWKTNPYVWCVSFKKL